MQELKYNNFFEIDEETLEIYLKGETEPLDVTFPRGWYPLIFSKINGKYVILHMHRVVAQQFVENTDPMRNKVVNHKDGNKLNYHPSNLEWVTYSENMKHAYAMGLRFPIKNSELEDILIHEICYKLEQGYRNKELAAEYPFLPKTILSEIRTGRTWKDISCLYKIPLNRRSNMSTETVHWICQRLEEGYSCSEISKLSSSKVGIAAIEKIRSRSSFKDITFQYKW